MRTSPRTAAAAWPAEPPTLRPLTRRQRLMVPLPPGAQAKPIGASLAVGETLCPSPGPWSGSSAVPLAPCAAQITGFDPQTRIVELEPAADVSPESLPPDLPPDALETLQHLEPGTLAKWVDQLLACGVQADRPGCPDLAAQLHGALRRPIDTILCRVLEDDPAVPLGSVLAAHWPRALLMGVGLLKRLTEARRLIVATDAAAPARWNAPLRASATQAAAQIIPLRNDYPQADPTLLIYSLLGRRLRPGRSPGEVGVILLDAAAAVAVGQAAARRQPMRHVPCSLHDQEGGRSYLFTAPVGTTAGDLLAETRLNTAGIILRTGHPLRDRRAPLHAPLGAADLSFHAAPADPPITPAPCIRCAWCLEGCPVRIHPAGLLEAAQRQDLDLAEHHGLDACIECGICTYVCPSLLPLLAGIRTLRRPPGAGH